ncbi:MAG TPA: right-handed parallel beta-helix repeat-containing protein, partial [Chitinophagaceae bacterium]
MGSSCSNITVKFTNIRNTGLYAGMANQRSTFSCEGIQIYGNTVTLQNNNITNSGFNPIDFQGNSYTIRNNYIDTFGVTKSDGGGIYTWNGATSTTYSNRVIDGNIVMNGSGPIEVSSKLTNGIYLDDNSNNVTVSNNTVNGVAFKGIYLHNAHEITLTGNTSYNAGFSEFAISHGNGKDLIRNLNISNNIFFGKQNSGGDVWSYETSVSDILSLGTSNNNYITKPIDESKVIFTGVSNSIFNHYSLAQWQAFSAMDGGTKKATKTITTVNDLRYEFNPTTSNKTINLGATYVDAKGTQYAGTITLAPYTTAILIYVSGTVTNKAPVANAGNNQSITLPANSVNLSGSGTDADGSVASYLWTKISGPTTYTIASSAQAGTAVTNLVQGVYQFALTVTDNGGATGKDTVSITVSAPSNLPPVADAGSPVVLVLPANSTPIGGSGSNDPDGSISSYSWTKISGPSSFVISNPGSSTTTVNSLTQGIYQFQLTVTDNGGAVGRDTVTVTVNASPNQLPTASAGTDITIALPQNTISLAGSGDDPDGTIASYKWTKISGPTTYSIATPTQAQTTVN